MKINHRTTLLSLVLLACATDIKVEAEGRSCDNVNACPENFSCVSGTCQSTGCQGAACPTSCTVTGCAQPTRSCLDSATAREVESLCNAGTGQCEQKNADVSCPNGCANARCVEEACKGVVCNMPPAATCDGNTRNGFGASSCSAGQCNYAPTQTNCASGCANGQCIGDPCAGVVCQTPPAAVCEQNQLRRYQPAGVCKEGKCDYQSTLTPCANGCAAGACTTTPSLTFSQTGPRIPFEVTAVDTRPGSVGDDVLAVGSKGEIGRWNGTVFDTFRQGDGVRLNAVQFAGDGQSKEALAAGANRSAFRISGANVVSPFPLPAAVGGSDNVIALSIGGQLATAPDAPKAAFLTDKSNVVVYSAATKEAVNYPVAPPLESPELTGIYLDEFNRFRASGNSFKPFTSQIFPSLAYQSPFLTGMEKQVLASLFQGTAVVKNISCVGPSTTVALFESASKAWVGIDNDIYEHLTMPAYSGSPAFSNLGLGFRCVGLAGVPAAQGASRGVYILASNSINKQSKMVFVSAGLTRTELLTFRDNPVTMSRSEGTGVVVAERLPNGKNNLFRTSAFFTRAIDVGEDFISISADGNVLPVLATARGDAFVASTLSATYIPTFGPAGFVASAVEARNGTNALLVGREGRDGVLLRTGGVNSTYERAANPVKNKALLSVCRLSDEDAVAVGEDGAWANVGGSPLTLNSRDSRTSDTLKSVACETGFGFVAGGLKGALVRRPPGAASQVTEVTPAFPQRDTIDAVAVQNGAIYAATAKGVSVLRAASAAWTSLPDLAGIQSMAVRGDGDVYVVRTAGALSEVWHFNGDSWKKVAGAPGRLTSLVIAGSRVLVAGEGGVVLEGR